MRFWKWFDGRKTGIAVVTTIGLGAAEHYGIALPPWVQDAAYALLGLGIVHKAAKTLPSKKGPTATTTIP